MRRTLHILQAVLFLALAVAPAGAFSLLGPYASWMDPTLSYQQPGDIGGPMDINEEYRWNVPVVTYAFDQSFLDYFGSNGVAAVEQAINVINGLPPASGVDLTNFPLASRAFNPLAGVQDQYDLKTATLGLLLEQTGLAPSFRNVFTMRRFDWEFFHPSPPFYVMDELNWPPGTIPEYVLERDFDPETLATSHFVNGILFSAYIHVYGVPYSRADFVEAVEIPVEIPVVADRYAPVADNSCGYGVYCTGLTRDDVGGLRYLLASNNVNLEVLLPDVHGTGTNTGNFVNTALRPGVEKVTFMRQEYDSSLGQATPVTNTFTDTYFTNGVAMHQQLERVITQPDFLFCVSNAGDNSSGSPMYSRTGTINWWNSAAAIGGTSSGPGVIRPPIRIFFKKNALYVGTGDDYPESYTGTPSWASFNETTNVPIAYPCPTAPPETPMTLRLHLMSTQYYPSSYMANYEWQLPLPLGERVALQSSTNLDDWVSYVVVTNQGIRVEWSHQIGAGPMRFFRVIPQ